MHLLLLEIDGSLADIRRRLEEAQNVGLTSGSKSGAYWRKLYDPAMIAQDELIPGSREFVLYLAAHKWRVVLLTKRSRVRTVYDATVSWLSDHGFDPFWFQITMKDVRFSHLSIAEWKALIAWWYASEGDSHFVYQRAVLVEPMRSIRTATLDHWNARQSGQELEVYATLQEFAEHLKLGIQRPKLIDPLLQPSYTGACQDIDFANERMWIEESQHAEEEQVSDDPLPIVGRMSSRVESGLYERSRTQEENQSTPLVEEVSSQCDADEKEDEIASEFEDEAVEEDTFHARRSKSVVFPRSDDLPYTRRAPEKKGKRAPKEQRTYNLAHLTLDE